MGCGGSKDESNGDPKKNDNVKAADDEEKLDVNDPEVAAVLTRKDSHAVSTDEPSGFVSKMKQMYQTRKAKMNGANEDVDQYQDEIDDSIPKMSKKDAARITAWVDSIISENQPGPTFDEVPDHGRNIPRPPPQSLPAVVPTTPTQQHIPSQGASGSGSSFGASGGATGADNKGHTTTNAGAPASKYATAEISLMPHVIPATPTVSEGHTPRSPQGGRSEVLNASSTSAMQSTSCVGDVSDRPKSDATRPIPSQ